MERDEIITNDVISMTKRGSGSSLSEGKEQYKYPR